MSATVSLSDEFMVVFSRADAANIRVALKKARASSVGVSLHAGVSVEFADPQAVADAATSLAEGVLGESGAKVDALLQQADLSSLSGAQKKVADALLARLGLSPSATAAALKEKIDEVRAKAHEAIVEAARTKIALGFTYEYRRVSQQVNLLQVVLSPEALQQCHGAIVKGRLSDVTSAVVDKKKGYLLETYLNESTVVRTRSFGFTLGIGKWVNIGGTDSSKKQWVVRRSLDGQRRQEAFRAYVATTASGSGRRSGGRST